MSYSSTLSTVATANTRRYGRRYGVASWCCSGVKSSGQKRTATTAPFLEGLGRCAIGLVLQHKMNRACSQRKQ